MTPAMMKEDPPPPMLNAQVRGRDEIILSMALEGGERAAVLVDAVTAREFAQRIVDAAYRAQR